MPTVCSRRHERRKDILGIVKPVVARRSATFVVATLVQATSCTRARAGREFMARFSRLSGTSPSVVAVSF